MFTAHPSMRPGAIIGYRRAQLGQASRAAQVPELSPSDDSAARTIAAIRQDLKDERTLRRGGS
jgi:hypothetical protein